MPTARARHLLTETDDVAAAIDAAALLYPGESRADVLRRLVHLGAESIAERHTERQRLVRELAGKYAGVYPPGYLDDLRDEWPE